MIYYTYYKNESKVNHNEILNILENNGFSNYLVGNPTIIKIYEDCRDLIDKLEVIHVLAIKGNEKYKENELIRKYVRNNCEYVNLSN